MTSKLKTLVQNLAFWESQFDQNLRETPYQNGVRGAMFIIGLINIEYKDTQLSRPRYVERQKGG